MWAPPVGRRCKHCRRSSFIIFCHLRWESVGSWLTGRVGELRLSKGLLLVVLQHLLHEVKWTTRLLVISSHFRPPQVQVNKSTRVCFTQISSNSLHMALPLLHPSVPAPAEIITRCFLYQSELEPPPPSRFSVSVSSPTQIERLYCVPGRRTPRLVVIFRSWLEAISTLQHTSQVREPLSFMNTHEIKMMTEHWGRTLKNCRASFLFTFLTNITKQAPDRQQEAALRSDANSNFPLLFTATSSVCRCLDAADSALFYLSLL